MTLEEALRNPPSLVGPSYNVYRYTDQIYKVVHFKSPRSLVDYETKPDKSRKGNVNKMDAAISRAKRVILELALCNPWDWFCTFTLDKEKYDRYNLKKFYKDFTQWIRDQRKKYGHKFRYVLIPELHKDGAWHMHALFFDVGPLVPFSQLRLQGWKVPDYLVNNGFYCWTEYHKKFGYNSFGSIRNPVAAGFYITKYMAKSIQESGISVGDHLYYSTQGLNRSTLHSSIYGHCDSLDSYLTNKYEWVETGFTNVKDNLDWTFALAEGCLSWEPMNIDYGSEDPSDPDEFDYAFEAFQEMLEGFD